ncbi:hypothetical protein WA026_017488 [Henosepilachna vigintioctopunctata]|uniref:Reverse transcriptase domain-containing protein n=1 Tax=Henosepilachna vigintioctopunctata TaxID=420089 RepID=A0AAW1V398_9CUCU
MILSNYSLKTGIALDQMRLQGIREDLENHIKQGEDNAYKKSIKPPHSFAFACLDDVVVLTESWLSGDILVEEFCPDSYTVFRCNRNSGTSTKVREGGIIMFVKLCYIS